MPNPAEDVSRALVSPPLLINTSVYGTTERHGIRIYLPLHLSMHGMGEADDRAGWDGGWLKS